MKQLGIALKNLGPSQVTFYCVKAMNALIENNMPVWLFYDELYPPCLNYLCPTSCLYEAWSFPGVFISTSFKVAEKSLKFPGPTKKYFYVYDLEWIYQTEKEFNKLKNVFNNPELELIAPSEEYKNVIERIWGTKETKVISNFNIESLIDLVK